MNALNRDRSEELRNQSPFPIAINSVQDEIIS